MSQDVVVHLQDDEDAAQNEVAHDQIERHRERESMTSGATEATDDQEAMKARSTTSPSSNDNDVDHNHDSIHADSSEQAASGTKHVVARVKSSLVPTESFNIPNAVNGTDATHGISSLNLAQSCLRGFSSFSQKILTLIIIVTPSTESFIRASPLPRDSTPPSTPPAPNTTKPFASRIYTQSQITSQPASLGEVLIKHTSRREAAERTAQDNMIFGSGSSKLSAAQRRRNLANTNAVTEEEAALTSKDRAIQKDAVRRFLQDNVREDWRWDWPNSNAPAIVLEPTNETLLETWREGWKERDEWSDNASEGGSNRSLDIISDKLEPQNVKPNPFRFDSPDAVGETLKNIERDRNLRRKKRLAEEMAWNEGLRCWSQRRDAWTGARHVVRSSKVGFKATAKQVTSTSMSSEDGGSSTALEQEEDSELETDTEIPIAPPFIPPENGMRRSITPANYNAIYDKVVLNQMSPLCPINLRDITKSCVKGWQRDGEWAPPAAAAAPGGVRRNRKLSVAALFGMNNHDDREKAAREKTIKESIPTAEPGKRMESPSTGIRGKLEKILHLRKNSHDSVTKEGD